MKKRLLSVAICFVIVAGLLAGMALPIYAEEEYDGENVVIPAKAVVAGATYNVRLIAKHFLT